MQFRASDVASATGGRLVGPDVTLDGASFDSRHLRPGQLFVALVAERDGHDFAGAAAAAGAPATLASRPVTVPDGRAVIEVADTATALLDLAAWARSSLAAIVVGITGSVGKTSTKDLVAAAVAAQRRVTANDRSFNNDQGLPVTVLGAPADTDVLVLEMGTRGLGEIRKLCAVARPDIGVVTAVAAAHTARLGGIDGVATAKSELVEALPAGGTALLNADDERVAAMATRTDATIVTFGLHSHADVRIEGLSLDDLARPRFSVVTPWGRAHVRLGVSGAHMAVNAAAGLAVAGVVGVELGAAVDALATASVSSGRMQLVRTDGGGIVVDDAYNANPASMAAALAALAAIDAERRIAVLGLMAELDDPGPAHRRIADQARELGIELVAVGTAHYGLDPVDRTLVADVIGPIIAGTAVLVKGSLVAGLAPLAASLAAMKPCT